MFKSLHSIVKKRGLHIKLIMKGKGNCAFVECAKEGDLRAAVEAAVEEKVSASGLELSEKEMSREVGVATAAETNAGGVKRSNAIKGMGTKQETIMLRAQAQTPGRDGMLEMKEFTLDIRGKTAEANLKKVLGESSGQGGKGKRRKLKRADGANSAKFPTKSLGFD